MILGGRAFDLRCWNAARAMSGRESKISLGSMLRANLGVRVSAGVRGLARVRVAALLPESRRLR